MNKLEKLALLNWANQLSDQELKKEYNRAYDNYANAIEDNHYFEIPIPKDIEEKIEILDKICSERGIYLL